MDSTTITAVITGIVSLVGGGAIGAAGKVWLDSRKQDADQVLAEDAQAIHQYSGLVERLEARIVTLESQHADCMNEHIKAMRELGRLEGMISEQRMAMNHLRESNTKQNLQAVEVAAAVAAKGVEVAANLAKGDLGPLNMTAERVK